VTVVRLAGVRKAYGAGAPAVDGIDLVIAAGEFFTLLGPSGSGKTTTLRLIAGFERPDAGRVELDGVDVAHLPPYARDVNTVFQDYALFPHMTVRDNVAYGPRARRVPERDVGPRVDQALAMVRLQNFAARKPGQLSGGQRQRVALARAIVNRPRVLLLDEPLGALDLQLRQQMQAELKSLQRETGITFLYVTHDQEEAMAMSDRVAVFNHGRVEQVGPPQALYEHPATAFVAGFVGISNVLRRDGRTLVLRPERVMLSDPAAGTATAEPAVVRRATYLGMFTRYELELDDGSFLAAVEQNHEPRPDGPRWRPGMRVRAAWREDALSELSQGE
jgi:putative spermidine/putrescine transport system ATP-binding protein